MSTVTRIMKGGAASAKTKADPAENEQKSEL